MSTGGRADGKGSSCRVPRDRSTSSRRLVEMGRFRLSAVQAVLDPEIPRRLAGHRLEISLPRRIRLGISETVVYTGRGLDFSYLIPVGSFYANQYNERDDDNILWGVDLKVPLRAGLVAHGELLVDDFQYEDRGSAPDRLAFNISIEALAAPFGRDVEMTADIRSSIFSPTRTRIRCLPCT